MLFCAAAALRQRVADDLTAAAVRATGRRIPLVTGLGATESAPFALCAGDADFTGGRIGVPVPGVELKVAPVGNRLEGRLRGPSITPGYWRNREITAAAFDEEGFYKLGDALAPVDPTDLSKGFVFEGRLAEDFKLSTGTWVRVGPLRAAVLAQLGDLAHDVVIAAPDRDFVAALIFPGEAARARLGADALRCRVRDLLQDLAVRSAGSSTTIRRALLLERPPAIDAQETTDKGSVNQKAVLANRAELVDRLFQPSPCGEIIEIDIVEERGIRATNSD
jgi:feruloyl-CoA synthase